MVSELIQLVSATRFDEEQFWAHSLLGQSLQRVHQSELSVSICFCNQQPLANHYNAAIRTAPSGAVLIFCHDDIELGPDPLDPRTGGWNHSYLSGALRHGSAGATQLAVYGSAPMPVQLLDGVFLAARAAIPQGSGVRFDPSFSFHFYGLNLCRSATKAGLRLGTWPLPLVHASGDRASGAAWDQSE